MIFVVELLTEMINPCHVFLFEKLLFLIYEKDLRL